MLSSDEVVTWTGHPVGGVCPFGLENPLDVFCDVSLRHYQEVLPAAGLFTAPFASNQNEWRSSPTQHG